MAAEGCPLWEVGLVESASVEGAGSIAVGSAAMEETEEDTAPAPARSTRGAITDTSAESGHTDAPRSDSDPGPASRFLHPVETLFVLPAEAAVLTSGLFLISYSYTCHITRPKLRR